VRGSLHIICKSQLLARQAKPSLCGMHTVWMSVAADLQATAAVTNNQHHQGQQEAPTASGSSQQHPQEQSRDFADTFDGDLAALLAASDDDLKQAGAAAQHADGDNAAAAAADVVWLHSWEDATVHEQSGINRGSTQYQGGSGGRGRRQAAPTVKRLDYQSSSGLVQMLEEQEHLRQQHKGRSAGSGGAGRQQRSSKILSAEGSSAGEGRCRASSPGLSDAAAHEALLLQQELEAALAGSSGGRRPGPRSNRGAAAADTAMTAVASAAQEEPCGYGLGFQLADLEQQQQPMSAAADVDVSWAQCNVSSAASAELEDVLGLGSAAEVLMPQRPRQQQRQQHGDALVAASSSGGSRRRSSGVSNQAAAQYDAAGGQDTSLWDLELQQFHSSQRDPSITATWAAADAAKDDVVQSSVVAGVQDCQQLLARGAGSGGAKRRSSSVNHTPHSPAVTAGRGLSGDLELCPDSPEQALCEQQQLPQTHHAAAGSGGSRCKRKQRGSSWQPDDQELLQDWQAEVMPGAAGSGGHRRQRCSRQDDLPPWLSDADAAAADGGGGGDDSCVKEQPNSILVEPHQQQLLQHWDVGEEGEAMPDAVGSGGRKRQRRSSYQCDRHDQLPAWLAPEAEAGAAGAGAAAACSHWTGDPLFGDTEGPDTFGQLSGQQEQQLEQQHQQLVEEELDWLDAPTQLQQNPDSSCNWGVDRGGAQHVLQQQQRLPLQRSPQPTRLHGCSSGASPVSCWMLEQQEQQQQQQQHLHLAAPQQLNDGSAGVSPMSCWMSEQEQHQKQQQKPFDPQPSGASVFWQNGLPSPMHCPLPSLADTDRLPETPIAHRSPDHLGFTFTSPAAAAATSGAAGQSTTGHRADRMWELSPCMSPLGHQSSQQEQQEQHRRHRSLQHSPAAASTGHGRSRAWQDAQARTQQQQQEREQQRRQQQQWEQQAHSPSLTELLQQPLPKAAAAQTNQEHTTAAAANTAATTATAPGRGRQLRPCLDGSVPFGQAHFPELSTGLSEYLVEGSAPHDTGTGTKEGGSAVTAAGSCASGRQQAPEAADSCDAAAARPTPAAASAGGSTAAAAGLCQGKRAELPAGVVARHTPAAGAAAAAVAPCINPSAAAASEDTVQHDGLAAAAAAAADSSADSKASRHDHQPLLLQQQDPPCRGPPAAAGGGGRPCSPPRTAMLPDMLLLPFSERLLMSAPPAAKKPRVFARSGIVGPLSSSHRSAGGKALCSSADRKAAVVSTTKHSGSRSAAESAIQGGSSKQDAALLADNTGCTAAAAAGSVRDAAQLGAAGWVAPATNAEGRAAPAGLPHAVQSRRHRRHTSPAVLRPATQQQQQQQHELVAAAASGLQQQQQQENTEAQQTHKQLVQARLPFRTVNGQLPKAASMPHTAASKHTLAGKLPRANEQLKPAWQQNGQENDRPDDPACLPHNTSRPGATAAVAVSLRQAALDQVGHTAAELAAEAGGTCTGSGAGTAAGGESVPVARAAPAAAAVAGDGIGAALTGLTYPGGALKSSLKGRRVSSSTASQQQQEGDEGEAQPPKPHKRVRFTGIDCSQEPAPGVDALCSMDSRSQQQQAEGQPLQQQPERVIAAQAAAQDAAIAVAGVAAAAADSPAATNPADPAAAAAAPQPTTPQGLVHDEHILEQPSTTGPLHGAKGDTLIVARSSCGSKESRFFQANSPSSLKATPLQAASGSSSRCKKLQARPGGLSSLSGGRVMDSAQYGSRGSSLASICRNAAEGSSSSRNTGTCIDVSGLPGSNKGSGSSGLLGRGPGLLVASSASQGPAILTVEELAGAVPGGLVPTSVSRQQLQDGAVIAQVGVMQTSKTMQGGGPAWNSKCCYCNCRELHLRLPLATTTYCPARASGPHPLSLDIVPAYQCTSPSPLHACDTQADNKLVVVRCGSVLLAVDQHAADERVQLEALQQQLAQQLHTPAAATHPPSHSATERAKTGAAGHAASGGLLKQQLLQRPQPLNLTLLEARALHQHQALIETWGWRLAAGQRPAPTATAAAMQPASSNGGCSSSSKAAAAAAATAAGRGGAPAVSNVAVQGQLSATTSAPAGAAAGQPGGRMHTSSSGSRKLRLAADTAVNSSNKAEQQQPPIAPTPTAGAAAAAEGGPLMLGTSQDVVLQAVPLLAGVQLGAVDLQVGSCIFASMTEASCCHSRRWCFCSWF